MDDEQPRNHQATSLPELEAAGTAVLLSIIKEDLHRHDLRGCCLTKNIAPAPKLIPSSSTEVCR